MVKGDTFTAPINFALQETMKRFENSDDVNDKIIYEGLRRSKAVWENIRNRQIMMRSDIKLPQPFASWSNSL